MWEEIDGMQVPHVIEEGVLNERQYTLMDFVEAPILGQTHSREEMVSQKIFLLN